MSTITLTDGRELDLYDAGGEGPVVLYHHGTPGSVLPYRGMVEAARKAGLRFVTTSRAGYGASTRLAGRTVADVAQDARQVLDHLGVDRCLSAGWSGGGPHALATAALLPGRVAGVLVMAGAAPYDVPELDFMAGMGEDNVVEFGAALEGEEPLRRLLEGEAVDLRETDGPGVVAALSSVLPEVDKVALNNELGEWLAANLAEALRRSVDGWVDDDLAFTRPWGFDPASIPVPVAIWQGEVDLMVPFAHGQWLADRLPTAVPHLQLGEGHISVVFGQIDAMFAELSLMA
jgi:pimeloyl-ACP methyl ester carboxylesterase